MQRDPTIVSVLGLVGGLLLGLVSADVSASSGLKQVGTVEMQFQQSERKNAPTPKTVLGRYLGSGNGQISGRLKGAIYWDLYEEQNRDDLHPARLVGVVVTEEGARIPFESLGYYKPRDGGYWDLTASIHFDCEAPGCPWPKSQPLLWKGTVKSGEWIHQARLYSVGD